jgi:predicted nucleotidyltransferase
MGRVDEVAGVLSPPQLHAARYVIARVRTEVGAELVQASLFGSRARQEARPDSDVDLLLVFRRLPPDREPYASRAERIAAREAARHGVPVTVWSVSLIDLALGNRTPMLVDALADSIHLWGSAAPLEAVPFTPRDALGCLGALLHRLDEGSAELQRRLRTPDRAAASRQLRDDLVRLCTASLLLSGITRPRRAEAVRRFAADVQAAPPIGALLSWAERSYGPSGTEEDSPVGLPPGGFRSAATMVESLRRDVARRAGRLRAALDDPRGSEDFSGSGEWSLRSTNPPGTA